MSSDIRWKQRFDNFDRAFVLLREVYERELDSLSRLERKAPSSVSRSPSSWPGRPLTIIWRRAAWW